MTRATQLAEAARQYRDNHHRVPLRLNGKRPCGTEWQKHTLEDSIPEFNNTDNIGILLGKPSGNLVRLDPDFNGDPRRDQCLVSRANADVRPSRVAAIRPTGHLRRQEHELQTAGVDEEPSRFTAA